MTTPPATPDPERAAVDTALDAWATQLQVDAHNAAVAEIQPQLAQAQQRILDLQTQLADALSTITDLTRPPILTGARANDIPFAQMDAEVGPIKVTRLFFDTDRPLPKSYTRHGIPDDVLLIISVKDDTNLTSFLRSTPADARLQVCFHHEPEGDFGGDGAKFVTEFNRLQAIAKAANPSIPFVFIAGGFQYGAPRREGYDGSFIPPAADKYYLDSYQRTTLVPAERDPSVQRYLSLLTARGKQFHGFTEYGRGVIAAKGAGGLPVGMPSARSNVFAADAAYLRSLPAVQVWCYWYTTDLRSGDQWRLTDPVSQVAWREAAAAAAAPRV